MRIKFSRSVDPKALGDESPPNLPGSRMESAIESPRFLENRGVRAESTVFSPFVRFDDLVNVQEGQFAQYQRYKYSPLEGTVLTTTEVVKFDSDHRLGAVEGIALEEQPVTETDAGNGIRATDAAITEEPIGNPKHGLTQETRSVGETILTAEGLTYSDGIEDLNLG